jgi:hypothetical protein
MQLTFFVLRLLSVTRVRSLQQGWFGQHRTRDEDALADAFCLMLGMAQMHTAVLESEHCTARAYLQPLHVLICHPDPALCPGIPTTMPCH